MIRLPLAVVEEANRLAVHTGLRLYVVGSFAAYAAGYSNIRPKDLDLIVVGDEEEYKDWEASRVEKFEEGEEGEEGDVRITRTQFGGLRLIFDPPAEPGGVTQTDTWHHPTLADYLNRQDKGEGVVIDPVTGKAFRPSPTTGGSVYAYLNGKSYACVGYTARETIADVLPRITKELDKAAGSIPAGVVQFDLRGSPGGEKDSLHHPLYYAGGKFVAPAAPAPAPAPVKPKYGARWYGAHEGGRGYTQDTTTQVVFESSESVGSEPWILDAVRALVKAGHNPTMSHEVKIYARPVGPCGTRMAPTVGIGPGGYDARQALAAVRKEEEKVQFLTGLPHQWEFGKNLVAFSMSRPDADNADEVVHAAAEALRAQKAGLILSGTRIGIKTARVEDKSKVVGFEGRIFTV